ncbi:MAG TPA: serine hydrolase [Bryobacteraceae bacterium]|nr:serine hydrolase [Bryobacteraceae bacterium]
MSRIRAYDASLNGVLGVAIVDLQSSRILNHNGETVFPQASSIKIPIMMEVFTAARSGKLKLDGEVTLQKTESVGGSGHLRLLLRSRPLTLTVRDLITAMIETSDNTATNKLIDLVGMDSVNGLLTEMGFQKTRLQRRMLDSKAASEDRENIATPLEMARLVELLYRGKAVDGDASKDMIEILKLVEADFRRTIPLNVSVASKPGSVAGVRAETGIIFLDKRPFVLSVMSTFVDSQTNPIPAITKMVFEHFEKLAASNRYGHKLQ